MEDTATIQEDLIKLANWSNKWQLPFNETKCKVIYFGKNNPNHQYQMNNIQLEAITEEKNLGVTFDSELKFGTHIRNIIAKANSRVGIIKCTFKILYKSLVRAIIEYCSNVWHPILIKDMKEVEKVQNEPPN